MDFVYFVGKDRAASLKKAIIETGTLSVSTTEAAKTATGDTIYLMEEEGHKGILFGSFNLKDSNGQDLKGIFIPHPRIPSDMNRVPGLRSFDYSGFISAAQKRNSVREIVKGDFLVTTDRTCKIYDLEDFRKKQKEQNYDSGNHPQNRRTVR